MTGIAAMGLALSACASPVSDVAVPDGADNAAVISAAAQTAAEAGSARLTGDITTSGGPLDTTVTLTGVQTFDPEAMDLTIRSDVFGEGLELRQILVDGNAYLALPTTTDQWVSADISEFAGAGNPFLGDQSWDSIGDVTETGTGAVEGVSVTFYEGTFDLGQALEMTGIGDDYEAKTGEVLAEDAGTATVAFAVDDDGRLVQWNQDTTVNLADGQVITTSVDLRWYDFGVETAIAAPPADQIVQMPDLSGLLPTD